MTIIEKAFIAGRSKQTWFDFQVEHIAEFTRDELVPMYAELIKVSHQTNNDFFVKKVNNAILAKFSPSGLNYIKERAWKIVDQDGRILDRPVHK